MVYFLAINKDNWILKWNKWRLWVYGEVSIIHDNETDGNQKKPRWI